MKDPFLGSRYAMQDWRTAQEMNNTAIQNAQSAYSDQALSAASVNLVGLYQNAWGFSGCKCSYCGTVSERNGENCINCGAPEGV